MASSNVKYKAKDGTLISLTTKVINNTTSTSTTDALSAAQGKELNDNKAASKVLAIDADLNTVKTPGIYSRGGGNSIKNKPTGLDAIGLIVVHNASGEYYTQILTTSTNTSTYRRSCVNGTWNAWTIDKYTDTTYSKSSLGLGNVDNTADANKSVKYATTAGSANAVAWDNVTGKPSTFAPAAHKHGKADITDFPSSLKNPTALTVQGNGTTIATYDGSAAKTVNITKASVGLGSVNNTADADKSVKYATSAGSANAVAWDKVSGKPSSYPPASHEHDLSTMINKLPTGTSDPTDADYYVCQYAGGGTSTTSYHRRPVSALWNYIKSKASSVYAAKSHTHSKSEVGLGNVDNTADSAKSVKYAASAGSANAVAWGNVTDKPSTFTPASHTHTKSEVGLGNVDNTADSAKSVKYATSAGSASSATTASKLGSATVGSASTPIYLNGGTATACTYSFSASTTDLTAGSSNLATNEIRFIYE